MVNGVGGKIWNYNPAYSVVVVMAKPHHLKKNRLRGTDK